MRVKIRLAREEFWYGSGTTERFQDWSDSALDRAGAQQRADVLIQQEALANSATEISGEMVPLTAPGTPWVSVNVGDAVRVPDMDGTLGVQRVVDFQWSLEPSGDVRVTPVMQTKLQSQQEVARRQFERLGPPVLSKAVSAVSAVLPESLPKGPLAKNDLPPFELQTDSSNTADWQVTEKRRVFQVTWQLETGTTFAALTTFTLQINNVSVFQFQGAVGTGSGASACLVYLYPGNTAQLLVDTALPSRLTATFSAVDPL